MRNSRGARERFDLSLESRQVAMLFVFSLVILTLVFALGIIVGRGMTYPTGIQAETGKAELASRPQILPEELPPEELPEATRPAPPRENDAPRLRFFDEDAETPAREVPVQTRPSRPVDTGEQSATAQQGADAPEERTAAAAGSASDRPATSEERSETKADKPYTIQVSAFQEEAQALRMVERLKSKDYEAYVVKASIPGRGVWYRVRIGQYKERDDAERIAARLKSKEGIATYVTLRQ